MKPSKIMLAWIVAASTALLAVIAFGAEAPAFPFTSIHQMTTKAPGIEPLGSSFGLCGTTRALELQFRVQGDLWAVYLAEGRLVGARYDAQVGYPTHLYFGTYNTENSRITIKQVEAFNPVMHTTPCTWLVPNGA